MSTHYEPVAARYDARYMQNRYEGLEQAIDDFVGTRGAKVLEVGCGTGHWLARLEAAGHAVSGLDPSPAMLGRARERGTGAHLSRGAAEALPFRSGSFDRVLMVNALHHFRDPRRALCEAWRVLRAGGRLMTVGLDPSAGQDSWCIYDYFEGTLAHDLARYPATRSLRAWLAEAGFSSCTTGLAHRFDDLWPAREALASGRLDKHTTSQLVDLTGDAYTRGIAAIAQAAEAAEARGDTLLLASQLSLFATYGERT